METTTYKLENDIDVFCIKAKSFPAGVMEVHQTMHTLVPDGNGRKYFGISRPEGGSGIVYRAGANELQPGELSKHNLEKFTLKKGNYICVDIPDFMKNPGIIGQTFMQLINTPGLDPQGACVELYVNNKDCKCMIRLNQ